MSDEQLSGETSQRRFDGLTPGSKPSDGPNKSEQSIIYPKIAPLYFSNSFVDHLLHLKQRLIIFGYLISITKN